MFQPMYNLVEISEMSRLNKALIWLHAHTGVRVTLATYTRITGNGVDPLYLRDLDVVHDQGKVTKLRTDSRPTPFPFGPRRFR